MNGGKYVFAQVPSLLDKNGLRFEAVVKAQFWISIGT